SPPASPTTSTRATSSSAGRLRGPARTRPPARTPIPARRRRRTRACPPTPGSSTSAASPTASATDPTAGCPAASGSTSAPTTGLARSLAARKAFEDVAGEVAQGGIARAHEQHHVAGFRLGGDERGQRAALGREAGVLAPRGDRLGQVLRGDRLLRRAARVVDLRQPQHVAGGQRAREGVDELGAIEARRRETVRLKDREQ